jgi:hypothetical protein
MRKPSEVSLKSSFFKAREKGQQEILNKAVA